MLMMLNSKKLIRFLKLTCSYCICKFHQYRMSPLILMSVISQDLAKIGILPLNLAKRIFNAMISMAESAYHSYTSESIKYSSMLDHDTALAEFKRHCAIAAKQGPNSVHPGILAALGLNVVVQSGREDLATWFSVNFCKAFRLDALPPEFRSQLDYALTHINSSQQ